MNKSIFYINSANRISGSDGEFQYFIPLNPSVNFDRVVLLAANIPKTYFQIQAGYNSFTLIEGTNNITISITPGTYTRNSFSTYLATLLTNSSQSGFVYSVTYPNTASQPENGKFTYTVSNNGSVQPAFICSNVYEQMGFAAGSINSFSSNTLVSTNVCNFSSETSLFIHSDIVYNYLSQDNILQEIYTAGVGYNSYINFTNFNTKYYSKPVVKRSQVYSFALTDEFGTLLNLNGVNMILTIMFYQSNKFESLVEHYIKYKINKPEKEEEINNIDNMEIEQY